MRRIKKIGLWQTAFLGDAALTLPVVHALRRRFPEAELHFHVRAGLEPLFAGVRDIDRTLGFAKRGGEQGLSGVLAAGRRVAAEGYDLWISAHSSFRSGLVARLGGAPRRIGYDAPWINRAFYTDVVDRRFDQLEEIERLARLLLPLGIKDIDPAPRLDLPETALQSAERVLAEAFPDPAGPLIGVHPGSVWPTKRWPEEHVAAFIRLALGFGARVVLFGGKGEEEALAGRIAAAVGAPSPASVVLASSVSDAGAGNDSNRTTGQAPGRSPARLVNLAGRLSLVELAACLRGLDVYLTNDSGPMHLAWVQSVPLVALFGPTVRSLGFYPRGEASRVLELDLPCRPCGLHGGKTCPLGTHACMRDLAPEAVFEAAMDAMQRHPRVRE